METNTPSWFQEVLPFALDFIRSQINGNMRISFSAVISRLKTLDFIRSQINGNTTA